MQQFFIIIGITATGISAMWIGFRIIDAVFFFRDFRRKVTDALDRIEARHQSKP